MAPLFESESTLRVNHDHSLRNSLSNRRTLRQTLFKGTACKLPAICPIVLLAGVLSGHHTCNFGGTRDFPRQQLAAKPKSAHYLMMIGCRKPWSLRWRKPSGSQLPSGHSPHHQPSPLTFVFSILFSGSELSGGFLRCGRLPVPSDRLLGFSSHLCGSIFRASRASAFWDPRQSHTHLAPGTVYFSPLWGVMTVCFWLNSCPSPESYFTRMRNVWGALPH
jgi:hypothetical protein